MKTTTTRRRPLTLRDEEKREAEFDAACDAEEAADPEIAKRRESWLRRYFGPRDPKVA